jgi:hypothetical protein
MAEISLDDIDFGDESLNRAWRSLREACEKANRWVISGAAEFDDGPGGFALNVRGGRMGLMPAVVATTITARVSNTVEGEGTVYLRRRTPGGPNVVQETTAVKCYSTFRVPVPVGTAVLVGPDGEAYQLAGADCPL